MVARIIERDLGYRAIISSLKSLNGAKTKVGIYGNGGGEDTNLAARAAVHEYGTKSGKIPSRPFMRQAFDNNLSNLWKSITSLSKRVAALSLNPRKMVSILGELHTGHIKESITVGPFKALKTATIMAKGSSTPLIDTGNMRASVTHKEEFLK